MLHGYTFGHIKKKLLEALEKSLGVVTTACKQVGCARSTFYDYMAKDQEFKKAVNDISEIALDFAESKLHEQISEGNTTATIFYLKTREIQKLYERQEISHEAKLESKLIEWVPAKPQPKE
ncbi:MAG: hypothetical protein CM15mV120_020 [uncultured marine virus]|nr:MAG: hypothetical protein CM15mV120_020 [uncultured marine virus]